MHNEEDKNHGFQTIVLRKKMLFDVGKVFVKTKNSYFAVRIFFLGPVQTKKGKKKLFAVRKVFFLGLCTPKKAKKAVFCGRKSIFPYQKFWIILGTKRKATLMFFKRFSFFRKINKLILCGRKSVLCKNWLIFYYFAGLCTPKKAKIILSPAIFFCKFLFF